jgi:C-methyltransferase C-terminal domain
LPWNLIDEIGAQLAYVAEWGAKLIVPIPVARFVEPGVAKGERVGAPSR